MNRFKICVVFLVQFLCCASSQNDYGCFGEGNEIALKRANVKRVARGSEAFTLDFFRNVALKHNEHNVILSPYSIWSALTLVFYGSNGETRSQLQRALGYDSVGDGYYNGNALRLSLSDVPGIKFYQLNQANFAIDFNLRSCISERVVQLKRTNFTNTVKSAQEINSAVAQATRDNIPTFLKPQDLNGARFVLINAVYFKGDWCYPFEERLTADRPFYDQTGSLEMGQTKTMFMGGLNKLKNAYFSEGYQVVQLPYSSGDGTCKTKTVSMWIILPDFHVSVDRVLQILDANKVDEIERTVKESPMEVILPKFNMTLKIAREVREALMAQGIVDAFGPQANLTNFVPRHGLKEPLILQAALHQATIQVNEKGTIASAATALIGTRSGGNKVVVNVNRPFIFMIRNPREGVTLFTGVVRDVNALNAQQ